MHMHQTSIMPGLGLDGSLSAADSAALLLCRVHSPPRARSRRRSPSVVEPEAAPEPEPEPEQPPSPAPSEEGEILLEDGEVGAVQEVDGSPPRSPTPGPRESPPRWRGAAAAAQADPQR